MQTFYTFYNGTFYNDDETGIPPLKFIHKKIIQVIKVRKGWQAGVCAMSF